MSLAYFHIFSVKCYTLKDHSSASFKMLIFCSSLWSRFALCILHLQSQAPEARWDESSPSTLLSGNYLGTCPFAPIRLYFLLLLLLFLSWSHCSQQPSFTFSGWSFPFYSSSCDCDFLRHRRFLTQKKSMIFPTQKLLVIS